MTSALVFWQGVIIQIHPGFSFGEIQKMFGNANTVSVSSNGSFSIDGRSFGGGDGIVTSRNIGANYADEFKKGFDIAADYFYSESDSENETLTERVNILPDARFFTSSRSKTLTDNANHSFNTELDIEVDSTFLINIRPSFQLEAQTVAMKALKNRLMRTTSSPMHPW